MQSFRCNVETLYCSNMAEYGAPHAMIRTPGDRSNIDTTWFIMIPPDTILHWDSKVWKSYYSGPCQKLHTIKMSGFLTALRNSNNQLQMTQSDNNLHKTVSLRAESRESPDNGILVTHLQQGRWKSIHLIYVWYMIKNEMEPRAEYTELSMYLSANVDFEN